VLGDHERTHVRNYDVQFAYADADEEEVIYRRVTVPLPLVERLLDEPWYNLGDPRAEGAERDDGDDGVPPVKFKRFDAESMAGSGANAGGRGAAVAAACTASSTGAAAN